MWEITVNSNSTILKFYSAVIEQHCDSQILIIAAPYWKQGFMKEHESPHYRMLKIGFHEEEEKQKMKLTCEEREKL